MDKIVIKGKTLISPSEVIEGGAVVIHDGKIETVLREIPERHNFRVLDFPEGIICPGFIDVHVHGANGYDTMDATYEALNGMSKYLAATGTTGFLATTVTTKSEDIVKAIKAVKETKSKGTDGAALLGVHLEGPFINKNKKGAQNGDFVRDPDPEELQSYIEMLGNDFKLITLAPELDHDFRTLKLAKQAGAVVSAGHSCCSYDTAIQAVDAGLSHATHLFNGMEALHHREPGLVGAMLADPRVTAELIADGIHLHPGIMKIVLAAKGLDKTVLITDCIRAGNLPDGDYELGGLNVQVSDGIARTDSGSLAGSTLSMIKAVKNMVHMCGIPLQDAVHLASRNPANVIGFGNKKGTLQAGKDADLIVMDADFRVQTTIVGGEMKFSSEW